MFAFDELDIKIEKTQKTNFYILVGPFRERLGTFKLHAVLSQRHLAKKPPSITMNVTHRITGLSKIALDTEYTYTECLKC